MTRKQILILVTLVALNVLVFCVGGVLLFGGSPSTSAVVAPTAIPVVKLSPATSTPVAIPPTPTLVIVPTTPTPAYSGPILAALLKSGTAASYRMEFTMTVRGGLGMPGTPTKDQELAMLTMSGELNGQDSHVTLKGLAASALSGDPNKAVEMIAAGGKNYIHGPVPLLGAKESRWYVLPAGESSSASSVNPNEFLSIFTGKEGELAKLTASATETLDGLKCDVYAADRNDAMAAFLSLSPNNVLSKDDLTRLQASPMDAEYKVWTCSDGYFHQLRLGMTGKDTQNPSQSLSIRLAIHFHDYGKTIKISAPANAIPATNPFLPTATPAKKK